MARKDEETPEFPQWTSGRIMEITDERDPLARAALEVIRDTFASHDRQPLEHLAMEIQERRVGLHEVDTYHILAAYSETGEGMAVAAGVYLAASNAGLVTYLGVRPAYRGRELGRRMRRALVDAFRADARRLGHADLGWVVGEVLQDSPWLQRLVRDRSAILFGLTYYHPGVGPGWSDERWILYRQPLADAREDLPAPEVRQLVYQIWRRAYRVRWPLEHEGFRAMMEELKGKDTVGAHPEGVG